MQQLLYISLVCCLLITPMTSAFMCDYYCGIPQEKVNEPIQLMRFRCGCMNGESVDRKSAPNSDNAKARVASELAATITKRLQGHSALSSILRRADEVCVSLCAIQMGGDACNCGSPSLPGK